MKKLFIIVIIIVLVYIALCVAIGFWAKKILLLCNNLDISYQNIKENFEDEIYYQELKFSSAFSHRVVTQSEVFNISFPISYIGFGKVVVHMSADWKGLYVVNKGDEDTLGFHNMPITIVLTWQNGRLKVGHGTLLEWFPSDAPK